MRTTEGFFEAGGTTDDDLCEWTSEDDFDICVKVLLVDRLRSCGGDIDGADLLLPNFSHKIVHVLWSMRERYIGPKGGD